jgi:hypothetical protein
MGMWCRLALAGELNKNFVDSMRIFYKALPNLLGKKPPEGIATLE